MPNGRLSAEQIVVLLRQIEVLMSQGKAAPVACHEAGISQLLPVAQGIRWP
jgi:putative transposase